MLEFGRSRIRLLASAIASAITLSVISNTVVLPSSGLDGPVDDPYRVNHRYQQFADGWGLRKGGVALHHDLATEGGNGRILAILDEPPELPASVPGVDGSTQPVKQDVWDALTDPAQVKPLRSAEEMARAQACFRRVEGYAHLVHMRKAGGSTLRYHLSELVQRQRERLVYVTEGDTFNASCFKDQGELVFITSMRHPIGRLVSAYWYEGRFTDATRGEGADRTSTRTFEEWLRAAREDEGRQRRDFSVRRVWHCVDNYYVKTLTNRYRQNPQSPVSRKDFDLAKRLLASLDAVVITEWMGLANQTAYLNSMLGITPVDRSLFPLNRQKHNRTRDELSPTSLAQLEAANGWDMLLYEFAKRLATSRLEAYQEAVAKGGVGEGKEEVTCKPPNVDPRWRKDGDKTDKPFPDSYLYSRPYCMDNAFNRQLLRELW